MNITTPFDKANGGVLQIICFVATRELKKDIMSGS